MAMLSLILSALGPQLVAPGVTPPRQISGSISNADYPAAAMQAEQQGTVRMRSTVDARGQVTDCQVTTSSGSSVLDATSCALLQQRFRFTPARDRQGRAVTAQVERNITWRLPKDKPAELPQFASGELRLSLLSNEAGLAQCAVETVGATFAGVTDQVCPPPIRVDAAQMAGNPQAVLVLTRLTLGSAASTIPAMVRGTLMARAAADIEVGADGRIASCHEVAVSGPAMPGSPCDPSRMTLPAFRVAAGSERRARVSYDVYRLGAPET